MDEARQVRDFWFGKLPMTAQTLDQRLKLWFPEDESPDVRQNRDKAIRARFGSLVERAVLGEAASLRFFASLRLCVELLLFYSLLVAPFVIF